MKYDVFICQASEDKEEFVRPLVERLTQQHIEVRYDEYSLSTQNDLNLLNESWVQLSACQTGFAIQQRLPIELVVPEPLGASKLIGSSSDMAVVDNGGVLKATGSLTFTIRYK